MQGCRCNRRSGEGGGAPSADNRQLMRRPAQVSGSGCSPRVGLVIRPGIARDHEVPAQRARGWAAQLKPACMACAPQAAGPPERFHRRHRRRGALQAQLDCNPAALLSAWLPSVLDMPSHTHHLRTCTGEWMERKCRGALSSGQGEGVLRSSATGLHALSSKTLEVRPAQAGLNA